jgi:hypothetical protein
MAEEVARKRGRPPGKNRRPLKKWDPKKWEPAYDLMVVLSLSKTNIEIGEFLGYTPEHVSNVLTSPTGYAKKAEIIQQGRDKLAGTLQARAAQVADLGMQRLHEILNDDVVMKKPAIAFAAIDRAFTAKRTFIPEEDKKKAPSVTVVQGNVNNTQVNNNVEQQAIFTGPQSEAIAMGLDKLQEIKKLHAPK